MRAEDGDINSFVAIGDYYYKENPQSRMALDWYIRAAKHNHPDGQFMLATFLLEGKIIRKSPEEAFYWLKQAYAQGCPYSIKTIGHMMLNNDLPKFKGIPFTTAEECYEEEKRLRQKLAFATQNTEMSENAEDHAKSSNDNVPLIFSQYSDDDARLEIAFKHLNDMIGLDSVKTKLKQITKKIEFDVLRKKAQLPTQASSHNFVFTGNAGVGKTEMARLTAEILKANKTLKSGHLVETDRSGLVGEYVGETAQKAREVILSALDGVLFIDEAYALFQSSGKNYGEEAIATLVKLMEDYKDRIVVILAGYPDEMDALLRMNPGLKSRFNHKIHFPDYNATELAEIYMKFVHKQAYHLDEEAKKALETLMKKATKELDAELGNGRFVRNAFERTIENLSYRVMNLQLQSIDDLQKITFTDIPTIDELMGRTAYKAVAGGNVTNLF
jgi:SpoVK/Ycf46/Vps4 family AAA+-type ATPase